MFSPTPTFTVKQTTEMCNITNLIMVTLMQMDYNRNTFKSRSSNSLSMISKHGALWDMRLKGHSQIRNITTRNNISNVYARICKCISTEILTWLSLQWSHLDTISHPPPLCVFCLRTSDHRQKWFRYIQQVHLWQQSHDLKKKMTEDFVLIDWSINWTFASTFDDLLSAGCVHLLLCGVGLKNSVKHIRLTLWRREKQNTIINGTFNY